ncbi:MAG: phospho-N-acetylmuramoyl-pentapeptide-transferase [Chlamydiales bacterium]|nr:phospho-N-acetylmuramoyl-pentapeptide-transferase [Chlamydiales bacterium]
MIFFILDFLKSLGIKVPGVFEYYSTRIILATITTLVISIFFGPRFIRKLYELKIGQPIRMEECPLLGELHEKKKDTPTMGGVLILFAMLVAMFLWMNWSYSFTLILFLTTLFIGALGARDDYLKLKYKNSKGLASRRKFIYQVAFSSLLALYLLCPFATSSIQVGSWFEPPFAKEVVAKKSVQLDMEKSNHIEKSLKTHTLTTREYISRIYIPFIKEPLFSFTGVGLFLMGIFIVVVVTGSSNAVNLTDGLDGLAAGSVLLVAASLALIAFISNNIDLASYLNILYIEGSGEIAIYLSALVGACLGFLWYNGYPAQVFMGDTGSLSLGAIIGVSAVLLGREVLLVIIGGIFVAEALSVILQVGSYKLRNKKRIFLCSPLHHHFEYKGWAETKVVIRFWIIGLLLAIVGVASLKFQ